VGFVPVGEGRTACGETGEGRLAEPDTIVAAVEAALASRTGRLRVLVTSGGTSEAIDGVRVLTNLSTGGTGAEIASHFARCGHESVLLRAQNALAAGPRCREETFVTFADLEAALTRLLGSERFDAVIHAAAVGDFGIAEVVVDGKVQPVGRAKLDSGHPPLLRLKTNPKLVDQLRGFSRTPIRVVAFKLTRGATPDEARAATLALLGSSGADWVVHNDLETRGEAGGAFPADIFNPDGTRAGHCDDREGLARSLERLLVNGAATV
jgi:phosphopantothenoylcysteine decarboxylase/phosphopantothenate--cysteine ligase